MLDEKLVLTLEELTSEERNQLLTDAIKTNNSVLIKISILLGAKVTGEIVDKALALACLGGDVEIVKLLLKAGADVNLGNKYDNPIHNASKNGHACVVKLLIEAGANLKYENTNVICIAAHNGHIETVKQLIKAGLNDENSLGNALWHAACGGHVELVKFLLEIGVDEYYYDISIQSATDYGHTEIVELFSRYS